MDRSDLSLTLLFIAVSINNTVKKFQKLFKFHTDHAILGTQNFVDFLPNVLIFPEVFPEYLFNYKKAIL